MKVHFIRADDHGSGYHDVTLPAKLINQYSNEWEASVSSGPMAVDHSLMHNADIIVIERWLSNRLFHAALRYQEGGAKYILHVDDDFWSMPPDHANRPFWDKHLPELDKICNEVDMIITKSPRAYDTIRHKFPKQKRIQAPVCVDFSLSPEPQFKEPSKIRIGFVGSASHHLDKFVLMEKIFKGLKKANLDFTFVLMGDITEFLHENIYTLETEYYGFVTPPEKSYEVMASLRLDIGLVPMTNSKFDQSRSWLKAADYGMFGTLPIISDCIPYNTLPRQTGIFISDYEDPEAWLKEITYLIKHPSVLVDLQKEAYSTIKRICDPIEVVRGYEEIFDNALHDKLIEVVEDKKRINERLDVRNNRIVVSGG